MLCVRSRRGVVRLVPVAVRGLRLVRHRAMKGVACSAAPQVGAIAERCGNVLVAAACEANQCGLG